ncbi:hypothetical protein [Paenibacillus caui]|uniref:hypothetical protein n=1 Tax=Paenibacillus caui TaxID=2873927 RepID=UPI001CA8793C|nr:hypothetical protein [Paenibacillus caui]
MQWRKIGSIRRWIHVFKILPGLLFSARVPLADKLLLLVPAVLYWVLPDVLPFIPIDDMAVTLLLMNWFVDRTERRNPPPRQ